MLAGIRVLHVELGYAFSYSDNWLINSTLKGIAHLRGIAPKQTLPITIGILKQFSRVLSLSDSFQKCFWATCLVAFYSFFRKSTLLQKTVCDHNCKQDLCRKDVWFNDQGAIIRVKQTKTLRNFDRELQVPLPKVSGSILCPVQALQSMLVDVNQPMDAPLFMYKRSGKAVPLTHQLFTKALKLVIDQIGLNSRNYSGHSFRRGGASFSFACGIPVDLIKTQGDWSSQAYERYLCTPLELRWSCAKALGEQVSNQITNGAVQ